MQKLVFHPIAAFQNDGTQFSTISAIEKCSLKKKSRKYVWFQWKGTLYELLCLCFSLGAVPLIFTKIIKVPISILGKLHIWVIIYLGDILLMPQTEELLMSTDMMVFPPTQLIRICNKFEKILLLPVQQIEFTSV